MLGIIHSDSYQHSHYCCAGGESPTQRITMPVDTEPVDTLYVNGVIWTDL